MFNVGDRIKFIRDNTAGGGRYGREGEIGIVILVYDRYNSLEFQFEDVRRQNELGFNPEAVFNDIVLVEPQPVVDNRQSVTLYTVVWKIVGDDNYYSSGCPTEASALSQKQEIDDDISTEFVAMKKITVRI